MESFAAALQVLNDMKGAGVVGWTGDRMVSQPEPDRPSPELLAALRDGKRVLREERRAMPLPDKVRGVMELQRACLPLVARRRALQPWERVWNVEA